MGRIRWIRSWILLMKEWSYHLSYSCKTNRTWNKRTAPRRRPCGAPLPTRRFYFSFLYTARLTTFWPTPRQFLTKKGYLDAKHNRHLMRTIFTEYLWLSVITKSPFLLVPGSSSNVQLKQIRSLWLLLYIYDYDSLHLWSNLYETALKAEKWP